VRIDPVSLYHFEVLRLRLGQSRGEAVLEAMGLAIMRMSRQADRLRQSQLRELEALSEDDPLFENFLDAHAPPLSGLPDRPDRPVTAV
jgi:hypothetical protein